jgi:ribosome biogenesis GTPase
MCSPPRAQFAPAAFFVVTMKGDTDVTLEALGWNARWAGCFAPFRAEGYDAGRISLEQKQLYAVWTARHGEIPALLTGKYFYEADTRGDLPVVGDWAVIRIHEESTPKATIHWLLPRQSKFSRQAAGTRGGEQPLAANIDTVLLVTGLDGNFNLRRIERYLTVAWESGAEPVVLLTKADLCAEVEERVEEVRASAPGVPVHPLSAHAGQGLELLEQYLAPGRTLALLGSSGVGKSTLLNCLLGGDVQRVQEVRDFDDRGRHTTTHRELFVLPGGALMVDTPGMRELQLWHADEGLAGAFPEIEALARGCRYHDCRHRQDPGCRVRAALEDGSLDPDRYENFRKMERELHYQATREDAHLREERERFWKQIGKYQKELKKARKKR